MTKKKKLYTRQEVREHLARLRNYEKTFKSAQTNNVSVGLNIKDFAAFFGKTVKIINQLNRPTKDY